MKYKSPALCMLLRIPKTNKGLAFNEIMYNSGTKLNTIDVLLSECVLKCAVHECYNFLNLKGENWHLECPRLVLFMF